MESTSAPEDKYQKEAKQLMHKPLVEMVKTAVVDSQYPANYTFFYFISYRINFNLKQYEYIDKLKFSFRFNEALEFMNDEIFPQ